MSNLAPTKLIDLPGIRTLELEELVRAGSRQIFEYEEFASRCAEVGRQLFGFVRGDILESWSDMDTMSDQEGVEHLRKLGWDLTDDHDKPLRITQHLLWLINAVATGAEGSPPMSDQLADNAFCQRVEAIAARPKQHERMAWGTPSERRL